MQFVEDLKSIQNPVLFPEKPPVYTFTQKLKPNYGIQRKKEGMLECFVSDTKAKVKWFKDGKPVEVSGSWQFLDQS